MLLPPRVRQYASSCDQKLRVKKNCCALKDLYAGRSAVLHFHDSIAIDLLQEEDGALASFEDLLEGNIGTTLAVGVGVAVVGPLLMPLIRGVVRPAAKAVIKAGMVAYDAGREGMGRLNEMSGDIVAEARSELHESRGEPTRKPAAATAGMGAKSG